VVFVVVGQTPGPALSTERVPGVAAAIGRSIVQPLKMMPEGRPPT
jgi:hypothetical protein